MKCEFSRRKFLISAAGTAGLVIFNGGCSLGDRNIEARAENIITVTATQTPDGELRVPGGGKLQPGTILVFIFPPDDEIHGVMFFTRAAELRALSTRCTHAACTLAWQSGGDTEILKCPCHGSRFDAAGQVLNGPAVLPLPRYGIRLEGDDAVLTLSS